MKRLLLLMTVAALLSLPGLAAPCSPATLATYIAMGPAGCVLGNLQVANFGYQASSSGGAAKVTPDEIKVTPLLAPAGSYALQFDGPWSVQAGQGQNSGITYTAASATASIQIEQVRLDGNGFQAGMFASVVVNEAIAAAGATRSLQVYTKCTEVCRSQTSASLDLTPALPGVVVSDKVSVKSKLGAASLTGFVDWLVVCIPCV